MRRSTRHTGEEDAKSISPADPLAERAKALQLERESRRVHRRRFFIALFVAVALQSVLVSIFHIAGHKAPRKSTKPMQVRFLPHEKSGAKKNMPKKLPVPEPDPSLNKQVVSIAPPEKQERPTKANYLAEHDSKTDHETQSAHTSLVPNRLTPKFQKSGAQNKPPDVVIPLAQQPKQQPRKADHGIRQKEIRQQQTRPQMDKKERQKILMPTWKDLVKEDGSPFADALEDVEKGDETKLNAWHWKHATFFNRLKQSVAQRWNPMNAIRRFDPQGSMLGHQDRTTMLKITIRRDGSLLDVLVSDRSGIGYLDDEAARAFRDAAPFPNPPGELFGENQQFSFQFGFMVNVDRGIKLDWNWNP